MKLLLNIVTTWAFVLIGLIAFAQPSNDNCAGATALIPNANCNAVSGTTSGATQSEPGCNGNADDDVWFSFVANNSTYNVVVTGFSGMDPSVQVFSGSCGSASGSSLACTNNNGAGMTETVQLTNLFQGATYWIRVYHAGTGSGTGNFGICVTEPQVEPTCDPNSEEPANQMNPCSDVPKICKINGFCGTTRGYHATPGATSLTPYSVNTWSQLSSIFCGSIENNSFFKFTASAANVQLRIYGTCTSGSGIQMLVFEHVAPPASDATCNSGAVNSYGCFSPISMPTPAGGTPITFSGMTPGKTYYMMVDGFGGSLCDYKIGADFGVQLSTSVSPTTKSICLGNSVNLVATGGDGTYTWNANPHLSNTTGANTTATPTSLGMHEYVVYSPSTDTECNGAYDTAFIDVQQSPSPYAGIDDTVCLGDIIKLNGVPSDQTNQTIWQYSAPGISPSPTVAYFPNFTVDSPDVVVNKAGLYRFILRESNTLCGTRRDTTEVLVIEPTQTVFSNEPSCFGKNDGEINITAAFANEFSFDNGTTWGPANQLDTFPAGDYIVCARNSVGCVICTDITVDEGPDIEMQVRGDTTVCENGTATIEAIGVGPLGFTYHWEHTTDANGVQQVNPNATQYFKVYTENSNGCLSPPDSVFVEVLPSLEMTTSMDTSICPGETAYLSSYASGGNGGPYNFTWSNGATTNNEMDDEQAVVPSGTTTYTVTLTDNCETSPIEEEIEVVIYPLPEPEFYTNQDSLCEPGLFKVYNSTDPSTIGAAFWEISNGEVFTSIDSIESSGLKKGQYSVSLTITSPEGCVNTHTDPQFLYSMAVPKSNFRYSPSPVTMFSTKVELTNISTDAVYYEWTIPGGSPSLSTSKNVQVTFPDGIVDVYPVELVVYSEFGCVDTMQQEIEILSEVILYVPNTFTPNGDDYNNTWRMSVNGVIPSSFNLQVYNRWGDIVFESDDLENEWDGTYKGKFVPTGVYTYRIIAEDAIHTQKYEWTGTINILK